MITLALLRHAKAVKDGPEGDHARRLSAAGRDDAAAMGTRLRAALPGPTLVVASDARRTRETATLAFPDLRPGVDLRLEPDLYGAPATALIDRLRQFGPETAVVLVGHNPGIGEAARRLAGMGAADAMARLADGFPTATAAVLRFDGPWSGVKPGNGRLTALLLRDTDD